MTTAYLLRRLLQVVPTVLGIAVAAFVLVHISPGDPVLALAGEHGDAAYYASMRARFGLEEPLPRQLVVFVSRLLRGDLGFSYVQGRPTVQIIGERLSATALLGGTALVIALVLSIPLGVAAARKPHSARDTLISTMVLTLFSAPAFWLAQLAILVFAVMLRFLPVQGMTSARADHAGVAHVIDVARHLALPALALAAQELAVFVRLTRAGLLDELRRDHIRTARAKGATELAVLMRHAFPRALGALLTVVGARVGSLIAGAAVVEVVFGWPGVGRLLLSALEARDAPILLGLFVVVSLSVVAANLVTDLVHAFVDPRVRLV